MQASTLEHPGDDWAPFNNQATFETAELLYVKAQASGGNIDGLMDIWKQTGQAPFANHQDLYDSIDSITVGDLAWQSFNVRYNREVSDVDPQWMSDSYEVFFRDPHLVVQGMLANPDFDEGMDFAPYRVFNNVGDQQFDNMLSGEWAWDQAVSLTCFH